MHASKAGLDSAVSAVFSYEFVDGDVDVGLIERIHRGAVDDWISHVEGSGLFSYSEVCAIAQGWRSEPKSLLDALLVDVDEVTVKRCEVVWAALDRVADRPTSGVDVTGQVL
ncbi:hypothetical protein [Rhodococcus sp. OK302]|uniref:hypothetical protein n=1 Tax=Rhodococcus sp. OK302 TaxID=1882769 RepID=UPI000B94055B|nr:hypothetical protein [Rhodococcus sp. OK302]OYD61377.1 hypothetical protein BDB13_6355 [Rhodococcus sp. OK302]